MIFERKGIWYIEGRGRPYASKKDAEVAAGLSVAEVPPLPEVREYDSLEEAIADQDKDELDRYEDELIAEEG